MERTFFKITIHASVYSFKDIQFVPHSTAIAVIDKPIITSVNPILHIKSIMVSFQNSLGQMTIS